MEVAQLTKFKGSTWATWDPDAPSFDEYVGDMKPYLEMFFDKPDGSEADIEVIGGAYKWTLPCNWKFGAENFIGDAYHSPSHRSVDLLRISPSGGQGRHTQDVVRKPSLPMQIGHRGSGRFASVALGDHEYTPTYPDNAVAEAYFREVHYRRQRLLGTKARVNAGGVGTIFPNGTTGTSSNTMCVWQPNGPDHTEQWRWYFVQQDAPQEVKDLLRHYLMRYGGPAGMTEEDDMENWNYAHKASKGVIARRYPYNYAMGLGHEMEGHPLLETHGLMRSGLVSERVAEQNQRGQYKMWATMMDAASWDDIRSSDAW